MKKFQYLNLMFLIILWGANIYAAINGFLNHEDSLKSTITPASYTFFIWGLIYVLLTCFVVYQFTKEGKRVISIHKIEWMFIVSVLLNVIWLYVWKNKNYILSVVILFVYLIILANIYITLEPKTKAISWREQVFVRLPFSINLAWVLLAFAVNVSSVLGLFLIGGGLGVLINLVLLGFVVWITYWNYKKTKDFAFLMTIVWGIVGIIVNLILK